MAETSVSSEAKLDFAERKSLRISACRNASASPAKLAIGPTRGLGWSRCCLVTWSSNANDCSASWADVDLRSSARTSAAQYNPDKTSNSKGQDAVLLQVICVFRRLSARFILLCARRRLLCSAP